MEQTDSPVVGVAGRAKPWGRRSDLHRWLRRNHAAFAGRLEREDPGWSALASEFASAGMTNARGGPPSADTLRHAWARVCASVEAASVVARARTTAAAGIPGVARGLPSQAPRPAAGGPVSATPRPTAPAVQQAVPVPSAPPAAAHRPAPVHAPRGPAPLFDPDEPGLTEEQRERRRRANAGLRADYERHDAKFRLG